MSTLWQFATELKDIFDNVTPKFVHSKYEIELKYQIRTKRIIVFVKIFRKESTMHSVLKTGMPVYTLNDVHFVKQYLSGLIKTFVEDSYNGTSD